MTDAELKANVIARLGSLGYTYNAGTDSFAIDLILGKIEARICHTCNISTIPSGCMDAEITDAACGVFLSGKKATGQLTGIVLEGIVKAITEGDAKVEFATGSTGANDVFDAYMKKLSDIDPEALISHRKLVW